MDDEARVRKALNDLSLLVMKTARDFTLSEPERISRISYVIEAWTNTILRLEIRKIILRASQKADD